MHNAGDTGSDLSHAIWSRAKSKASEPLLAALGRCIDRVPGTVTTWTLIDEMGADGRGDLLAALPDVVDVRAAGDGRVYLHRDHEGAFVLIYAPGSVDGVTHLFCPVSYTDTRWGRIQRAITRTVRSLSPVYLNEGDFLSIGDVLAEHGPVEASRLTARDLVDGSSYTRGWPEARRRVRPSHRDALEEARRLAVRSITVHVGERLHVQLRREAAATFYSGDFRLFADVVLGGMARAASLRRELLAGRQRVLNAPSPRPIAVRTDGATLGQPDAIQDLLEALEGQASTGVAVFHRNPYLHAAVTDYSDGSNFDVFVNDSDELVVIPGYRASIGALARLTDTLGVRLSAVEVGEAAEVSPATLDDLLGSG